VFIKIDRASEVPVYRQIYQRIIELIREGTLKPGQRLPPSRELARLLGVSRRTVSRAYDELIANHWLESRTGSGTFVSREVYEVKELFGEEEPPPKEEPPRPAAIDWSKFMLEMRFYSALPRERLPEGTIRFTQALPDPSSFPFEEIKRISTNLLWKPEHYYFDYSNPQGYPPLLDLLHEECELDGIDMGRNVVVVTMGFQQALDLVTSLLVEPGTAMVIEEPTYNATITLVKAKHFRTYTVPVGEEGVDLARLERRLRRGDVRLVVVTPTLHNPTTVTMGTEARMELIRICARHQVPILEDDYASDLHYRGMAHPTLKALDEAGAVILVRSFSKSLLPGLRIGYMVVPREIALSLVRLKRAVDKGNPAFFHVLLEQFMRKGFWRKHLGRIRRLYEHKLSLTLSALRKHLPDGVNFRAPEGGFFVWLRLPEKLSGEEALERMRENLVEAGVYNYFNYHRADGPGLRVAFSMVPADMIEPGIERLGRVLKELLSG